VLILALDTSSSAGSAALVRDGQVIVEHAGDPSRTHGERLPRELMTVLDEARVTLADVGMFAVAIGPGSFTGLRIGIAAIQGLALAQDTLVAPVSTFESLALTAAPSSNIDHRAWDATGVWIDAHRGEVFATLYGADGTVLSGPTSLPPAATLDRWVDPLAGRSVGFAGDGALKYREAIDSSLGGRAGIPSVVPPLAGAIGLIAAREPGRAVRPHALVPLYVRRPDAELARDRRQQAGGG
jgi:tRNA threonylcarbamoyladenosine biosynthesis protein TsaB